MRHVFSENSKWFPISKSKALLVHVFTISGWRVVMTAIVWHVGLSHRWVPAISSITTNNTEHKDLGTYS